MYVHINAVAVTAVFARHLQIIIAYTYLELGYNVKGERLVAKLLEKAKREGDDILYWEGDRSSICKFDSNAAFALFLFPFWFSTLNIPYT